MTPPPSSQMATGDSRFAQHDSFSRLGLPLASPPPTLRTEPPISAGNLYGEVPTMDAVERMNEEELRSLVSELLPALGEARISVAHSQLQHSLLAIETKESIKRAEVEHEAIKREVQVLQEGSPVPAHAISPVGSPNTSTQRNLHVALMHCRELQQENAVFEKRLRASKKLIARLDSENVDLKEHVKLLRQRIKDNRDHLNDLQESGAVSLNTTPRHGLASLTVRGTPRTPASRRLPEDFGSQTNPQTPFDTLLQAAKWTGEATSVPASPSQQRQRKMPNHMRGTHSLSSLPTTPQRRPMTAEGTMATPSSRIQHYYPNFSPPRTQLSYHPEDHARDDRESTISLSDNEDGMEHVDDIPGSQASQVASQMLRRTLEEQSNRNNSSKRPPSSNSLRQGKLYGQVTKPLKRAADDDGYDTSIRSSKLAKTTHGAPDRIGLGIGTWPNQG